MALVLLASVIPLVPSTSVPTVGATDVASSLPADGTFLTALPTQVSATFTELVLRDGSNLSVVGPAGMEVNGGPVQLSADGLTISVSLPGTLANGLYTVNWKATNLQGHHDDGTFHFGLRVGGTPPRLRLGQGVVGAGLGLDVSGMGFKSNGAVVVSICADNEFVGLVNADAQGNVSGRVVVPNDVPYGSQTIALADGDGASANGTVMVNPGGSPAITVRLDANSDPQTPDDLVFVVTILNRSAYHLTLDSVHLPLPAGVTLKTASAGGQVVGGDVVWTGIDLAANQALAPLTADLNTSQLPDNTPVDGQATVAFSHVAERTTAGPLPAFNGLVTSAVAEGTSGGYTH